MWGCNNHGNNKDRLEIKLNDQNWKGKPSGFYVMYYKKEIKTLGMDM